MNAQTEIVLQETPSRTVLERLSASGEITTGLIRTLPEVEEIRPVWERWSNHPNSDIDFFLMNLRNEPGNPAPHIIVVYRNGGPECMLVGRIARRTMELKLGYKTFFSPEARVMGFVYSGLLGNITAESSHAVVDEISKCLERKEADAAFLNFLPTDGPLYESVRHSPRWFARDHFPKDQIHRSLSLAKSSADFLRSLSANERRNHKRRLKKVCDDFGQSATVISFQKATELETLCSESEQIAVTGYQRALGVGFTNTQHLRSLLELEADRGRLRGYILYVAAKPCAFWIGTLFQRTFYSDYMGYDPEYSKYAPGNILTMQVVERLCDSGEVDRIDFGLGDAEWKQKLADSEWHEASSYLFGCTGKGWWLNALRTPTMLADQTLRRVLQKSTGWSRIKTKWRRQLTRNEGR
jgi:Acetyltransferase (GNAT) domain